MQTTNQTPFLAIALLLAACAGGAGGEAGGGNSGGGDPGGGGEPPPEAPPAYPALFTTPHSISGYQIEAGYGPYAPYPTTGSVTEDSIRIGNLSLTSPRHLGEDGPYDIYNDYIRTNTNLVYTGYGYFQEFKQTTTNATILRSGEDNADYNYASYGYWTVIDSVTRFIYGTQITSYRSGYSSFGIEPGNVPATGTASYAGLWDGKFIVGGGAGGEMTGTATFSADFDSERITGVLTVESAAYGTHDVQMDEIAIDAGFADGPIIGVASTTMSYDGVMQELAGDVAGEFYGPAADELSGAFHIITADGSLGAMGGFAARQ